jgi:hypothetical protein
VVHERAPGLPHEACHQFIESAMMGLEASGVMRIRERLQIESFSIQTHFGQWKLFSFTTKTFTKPLAPLREA